jgi:hypothetical protein
MSDDPTTFESPESPEQHIDRIIKSYQHLQNEINDYQDFLIRVLRGEEDLTTTLQQEQLQYINNLAGLMIALNEVNLRIIEEQVAALSLIDVENVDPQILNRLLRILEDSLLSSYTPTLTVEAVRQNTLSLEGPSQQKWFWEECVRVILNEANYLALLSELSIQGAAELDLKPMFDSIIEHDYLTKLRTLVETYIDGFIEALKESSIDIDTLSAKSQIDDLTELTKRIERYSNDIMEACLDLQYPVSADMFLNAFRAISDKIKVIKNVLGNMSDISKIPSDVQDDEFPPNKYLTSD